MFDVNLTLRRLSGTGMILLLVYIIARLTVTNTHDSLSPRFESMLDAVPYASVTIAAVMMAVVAVMMAVVAVAVRWRQKAREADANMWKVKALMATDYLTSFMIKK